MDSVGSQSPIPRTEKRITTLFTPWYKWHMTIDKSEVRAVYPSALDLSTICGDFVDSVGGGLEAKTVFYEWMYLRAKHKMKKPTLATIAKCWGHFIHDLDTVKEEMPKLREEFKKTKLGLKIAIHEECGIVKLDCANQKYCPVCPPNAKRFDAQRHMWKDDFNDWRYEKTAKCIDSSVPSFGPHRSRKESIKQLSRMNDGITTQIDDSSVGLQVAITNLKHTVGSDMIDLRPEMTRLTKEMGVMSKQIYTLSEQVKEVVELKKEVYDLRDQVKELITIIKKRKTN